MNALLPGYAIVRFDSHPTLEVGEDSFTVKRVVWDPDLADAEAARLNELNADKGASYSVQYTRVDRPTQADLERERTS